MINLELNKTYRGDVLQVLKTWPDRFIQTGVTSPPYWGLRDYGIKGQLGLEKTPEEYIAKVVEIFREFRRCLRDDGTLFLNLGDSYYSDTNKGGSGTPNGRNNRGESYARGQRGASCNNDGTEQQGLIGSDCLCENLCDECLEAFRHSPHTFRQHVSKLPPLSHDPNRGRKESQSGRPPTSGSAGPDGRNVTAKRRMRPSFRRDRAIVPGALLSTKNESSQRPQGEHPLSGNSLASQNEGGGKKSDVSGSGDKRVCICGKALPAFSSVCRISGKAHSGGPYQDLTISSHLKSKDLCGMPWAVAFALRADGWYLRSDIIWNKPNPMPESCTDRPTKAHEYIFLLTKSAKYFYDNNAIREPQETADRSLFYDVDAPRGKTPTWGIDGSQSLKEKGRAPRLLNPDGRNKRSVWEVATQPYSEAHFSTFPEKLIEPCILAGTSEKGCCEKCGMPVERIIEPSEEYKKHLGKGYNDHKQDFTVGNRKEDTKGSRMNADYKTVGWQLTCKCKAGTKPCVVCDPFMGAGTTALVACKFNRQYVGIELSKGYIVMAERRIAQEKAQLKMF